MKTVFIIGERRFVYIWSGNSDGAFAAQLPADVLIASPNELMTSSGLRSIDWQSWAWCEAALRYVADELGEPFELEGDIPTLEQLGVPDFDESRRY